VHQVNRRILQSNEFCNLFLSNFSEETCVNMFLVIGAKWGKMSGVGQKNKGINKEFGDNGERVKDF